MKYLSKPDLVTTVREHRVSSYRMEPGLSNRASELGNPCLRNLVYSRVDWDQAEAPNDDSISIFAEGDLHEDALLRELAAAGVSVVEQQAPLHHKELNITGHVDAVVRHADQIAVLEIKSMHPYIWRSIFGQDGGTFRWADVEDGFDSRPWLRKYYPQVQLYIVMRGANYGILLCKDKGSGALAQVIIEPDTEEVQRLCRRAVQINNHVDNGTLPPRTMFPDRDCPSCQFLHHCNPELGEKSPLTLCDDETVEGWLEEREGNKEASRAYKKADEKFKEWMKSQEEDHLRVGRFVVKKSVGKNSTRCSAKLAE